MISNKFDLIQDADKILVIKMGEIEQMGSHTELLKAGGLYADLYKMHSGWGRAVVDSQSKPK
jgi:ABC-type multidrug transport system fused ATPase/permease subunit